MRLAVLFAVKDRRYSSWVNLRARVDAEILLIETLFARERPDVLIFYRGRC